MSSKRDATRVAAGRTGFRGVFWDGSRNGYKAEIYLGGRRRKRLGLFSTPEQAAEAYDHAARALFPGEGYRNFPGKDERVVVKTLRESGRCVAGHDLTEHGYRHLGKTNCRICNAEAVARYQRRRLSQD